MLLAVALGSRWSRKATHCKEERTLLMAAETAHEFQQIVLEAML
jgi:hypothetical protein